MAERRMFAKTIIDSDAFLDMPASTQMLYFHLSMRADDEGFINNPKRIQRMVGASDDDLKLLLAKNFIIAFESGVVVIKHWRIHNYIQKDRFKETVYSDERMMLDIKGNGAYTIGETAMDTECIQDGYTMDTQVRIGKDRTGKVNNNSAKAHVYYPDNPDLNEAFEAFIAMRKKIRKPMTEHAIDLMIKKLDKLSGGDSDTAIQILEASIEGSWTGIYELKEAKKKTTGFSNFEERKVDYNAIAQQIMANQHM